MSRAFFRGFDEQTMPIPEAGCVLWLGNLNSAGYGHYNPGWGNGFAAHRYAYERAHGPIPEGMDCCHHCDVPCCVNPYHLFAAPHAINMEDASRKGRLGMSLAATCGRGHSNWRTVGKRRVCVDCQAIHTQHYRSTPEYRQRHAQRMRRLRARGST